MSRTQRLLELMQLLRKRRTPIPGNILAKKLEISARTLYRDIATLKAQGACIDGEPGIGYLLQPGFTLPPLMFSENEIEAISLGMKWVTESADQELSDSARDVLAKIAAVIPERLRMCLYVSPLLIGPSKTEDAEKQLLRMLRGAIRKECKLSIDYLDGRRNPSSRIVWPFGLAFFDQAQILLTWCEKREAFRHFRIDRICRLKERDERYPKDRKALLADWRAQTGVEDDI